MSLSSRMQEPAEVRRVSRRKRRTLSPAQQRHHSLGFAALARKQGLFLRSQRIAAYIGMNGELDPSPLFDVVHTYGKQLYLPVLRPHPQLKLWFIRHPPQGPLVPNRFGIPEPPLKHRRICLPWALDLVLVPLVAFDAHCNRLGMGGGYYDRTLSFLRHRCVWRRPRLIGVGHECQRADRLPTRDWDVPLDMVITERRVYRRSQAPVPANRR